ncbi:MAG: hemerythrin domain-containing protein [Bacteroidetes bacterium]|nr:MAG: hemerythrin domain-containing protein [Bacteroidota bacterium]
MSDMKVTNYYEADHDRLDELFKQFQQLKRQDMPKARELFTMFRSGLLRHIIWEEEILFPLFEQKTGMYQSGPTEVMRMEHRIIKKHLETIYTKAKADDPSTDEDEQLLLNTLVAHNHKEEQILYPAIDRSLTNGEVSSVFTTMEKVPEERYK